MRLTLAALLLSSHLAHGVHDRPVDGARNRFLRRLQSSIYISSTAGTSTISSPETAADSGNQLKDSDISKFLDGSDLVIDPSRTDGTGSVSFEPGSSIFWASSSTLSVSADTKITLDKAKIVATANGEVSLDATSQVVVTEGSSISTESGNIKINGGSVIVAGTGTINAGAKGNVVLTSIGAMSVGGDSVVGECGQYTINNAVSAFDKTPPTITCPATVVGITSPGACTYGATFAAPVATDNCEVLGVQTDLKSGYPFPRGKTVVTGTAIDGAGNLATCGFNIEVSDTEDPVILCPATMKVPNDSGQCSASATFSPQVTDNCPGVEVSTDVENGVTVPVGKTTTVTATATDSSANTASCTFDINVIDTEKPTIICPVGVLVDTDPGVCTASASYIPPTAADNCGDVSVVTSIASGTTFKEGTTAITGTAIDQSGNRDTCTFDVKVTDNEDPVITCPVNVVTVAAIGTCSANAAFKPPTAKDNCGIASVSTDFASGTSFPGGTTTVTGTATDVHGNTGTCKFDVTVADAEAPTTICPADMSIATDPGKCSAVATFAPKVVDNCPDATLTSTPESGTEFSLGKTTVKATGVDAQGTGSSCEFDVTVVDQEPPQVVCPGTVEIPTKQGRCHADAAFSAPTMTDNCQGGSLVTTLAPGDPIGLGTTRVAATATDAVGIKNTCTFDLVVTDKEKPTIICPENLDLVAPTGQCAAVGIYAAPAVNDNCIGATGTYDIPSGSRFPAGQTTVTGTAKDAAGNTATCSFVVTVRTDDKVAPEIRCPADVTIETFYGHRDAVIHFEEPMATDNCGTVAVKTSFQNGARLPLRTIATREDFAIFKENKLLGETTITGTATDANGNKATCVFNAKVQARNLCDTDEFGPCYGRENETIHHLNLFGTQCIEHCVRTDVDSILTWLGFTCGPCGSIPTTEDEPPSSAPTFIT